MDYSSNINFSDSKRVQTLYASQLYGTFFGIFATFEVSKTTVVGTARTKILSKINFSLINYKGPLNLEIKWAGNVRNINKLNLPGVAIDIHVQHTSSSKPFQLHDPAKPGILSLDLTKKSNYLVQSSKDPDYIYNSLGITVQADKDYLRLERTLLPMVPIPANDKDYPKSSVVNGIFDEEFYIRDGNYVTLKNNPNFLNPIGIPQFEPNLLAYPNDSCPPSNSKILFD